MIHSTIRPDDQTATLPPALDRVHRIFFAVCIVLTPLATGIGVALSPGASGTATDPHGIIASFAAHADRARLGVVLSVIGLLSPFGIIGLARLAIRRAPWLAAIGGAIALAGWATMPVFAGQDALTFAMANMGGGDQLAVLWNLFNTSATLNVFLSAYIIGHVGGTLLVAIALGRAHAIPGWAVVAIALYSPLQMARWPTGIPALAPTRSWSSVVSPLPVQR